MWQSTMSSLAEEEEDEGRRFRSAVRRGCCSGSDAEAAGGDGIVGGRCGEF